MASLFDIGRPTGAMAGHDYAEKTRRERRDSDLTFKTKQAEFFDYIDGIEDRQQARQTNIAVNKARRQTIPSETNKIVETNKTATEQTLSDRRLIPANEEEHIRNQHVKMSDDRYKNLTRHYSSFREAQRTGGNVPEAYARARQVLIDTDPDPARAEAYFTKLGITKDATPQALQAFEQLATIGMHDSVTTQKEHLIHTEMGYRAAMAASSAKQGRDVSNSVNKEYLELLGSQAERRVKGFNKLEGDFDKERKIYTGDKAVFLKTVAGVAQEAARRNIYGDIDTSPQQVEEMSFDIFSAFNSELVDRDLSSMIIGVSSDDINAAGFADTLWNAYGQVEAYRRGNPDPDKTFYQTWQDHKTNIIGQMKADAKSVVDEKRRALEAQRAEQKRQRDSEAQVASQQASRASNLYAESQGTVAEINRKIKELPPTVYDETLKKNVRNPEVMALIQQRADLVNSRKTQ